MKSRSCVHLARPPYAPSEVGGRSCRQPGQVRKEAATTISCRVVGFHRSPIPALATVSRCRRRGAMDDFSFLSGLFGILFGLIVAELATKFADAINLHHRRPIGLL